MPVVSAEIFTADMTSVVAEETKIIYHIDDEETPYLIKLPISTDKVTLGDFKNALNRPNYKFFFKSMDDDFGLAVVFILFFIKITEFICINQIEVLRGKGELH